MRRGMWLATGVAIGAGGSIWVRRRVEVVSERLRSGSVGADVASIAGRGARAGASRVLRAVEAGKQSARAREEQLWEELEVRARAR